MKKEVFAGVIALAALIGLAIAGLPLYNDAKTIDENGPFQSEPEPTTFSSSQEMQEYFERASSSNTALSGFNTRDQLAMESARSFSADSGGSKGQDSVYRYAKTNNQESNVQEPDILKTDGEEFYYSPLRNHYSIYRSSIMPPEKRESAGTSIFSGLKQNLSQINEIDENGEMLLSENLLTVQNYNKMKAYNVSDPESPEENWEINLNGSIVASRQIDDSILLILREGVDRSNPCPIPLTSGSDSLTVRCDEISYLPSQNPNADSTYTALKVSKQGEVEDSTSIVGSASNTVVYVSESSIYITNRESMSEADIITDFLQENKDKLFTDEEVDRIDEILGYDISDQSKMIELRKVFESHTQEMKKEERREWQESFENQLGNYTAENKRKFTSTSITEIGTENMDLKNTGEVPGSVNDQFSIDEKEGRLRIATTVGTDSWRMQGETANDMYILDENLEKMGSVTDMGLNERIYSARFIDDKAYIVTFRRIDPFHIVDLSDPENPELKGELKLPGFSSYLHQLDENRILGVGEENGKVKAVVFNVEDDEPTIEDSEILEDYSSEINQNHHAFMLDKKHEVFFLPGDNGGYIYSYSDGLEKKMEIDINNPNRARYVNDHLYVFGDYSVSVINEDSWEVVKELKFRENSERNDGPVFFEKGR